jgi:hypothetical protein
MRRAPNRTRPKKLNELFITGALCLIFRSRS